MDTKLLFVCLGNICRSPSAEAVMQKILRECKSDLSIVCDSAGTYGAHQGEKADSRMRKHGERRGYKFLSRSRKFEANTDFDNADLILAMDKQNMEDLLSVCRNSEDEEKLVFMTDYCHKYKNYDSVPDPYYGGEKGFELVLDLLEDACSGLLIHLKKNNI